MNILIITMIVLFICWCIYVVKKTKRLVKENKELEKERSRLLYKRYRLEKNVRELELVFERLQKMEQEQKKELDEMTLKKKKSKEVQSYPGFRPISKKYNGDFEEVKQCEDCFKVSLVIDSYGCVFCKDCGGKMIYTGAGKWNQVTKKWIVKRK